jgi:hypothetical protein
VANNSQEWIGISGESYVFGVFPINTNFTPSIDGNYIFAKQLQDGWHAVYIGEGDIKDRTEDHIHEGCVVEKGATHIHVHPNNNKNERKRWLIYLPISALLFFNGIDDTFINSTYSKHPLILSCTWNNLQVFIKYTFKSSRRAGPGRRALFLNLLY